MPLFQIIFFNIKFQLKKFKFGLVSLFNGVSTFVGYLTSKPSLGKNSNDTI